MVDHLLLAGYGEKQIYLFPQKIQRQIYQFINKMLISFMRNYENLEFSQESDDIRSFK